MVENMNIGITKLIADISKKCIENKINFRLEYAEQVDTNNIPCSGYFDEKSLVVATKKKKLQDWLDILIHESCHLDQFVEKSKVWCPDELGLFVVESWIQNKKINSKKVVEAFHNTILLELDCEKRTVKKIKKYKLNFNIDLYIQKANAYLYGYGVSFKKKVWPNRPYERPSIINKMPKKFLKTEEYFNIPDHILSLYKYSYEKNT
jgi:hypothetical protein